MTRRLGVVVYVCADRGVPVFGPKGSSGHVRAVLEELRERSHELHVVCRQTGTRGPGELDGVHIHEVAGQAAVLPEGSGEDHEGDPPARQDRRSVVDDEVARRVAAIVGDRHCDLLYERYSLWSAAALELAADRGWPSVLEINAPLLDEAARHRDLLDWSAAEHRSVRAFGAATVRVAVSGPVAAWAEQLVPGPVVVVPNGVDVGRFAPTTRRGCRRRRGPGATDSPEAQEAQEALTIGFVGSFKPWHDLDTVVEAMERLGGEPDLPPLRLLLVGDGPRRRAVLDQLRDRGLAGIVDAPGSVPAASVPRLVDRMDIAVAPYGSDEDYFSPLKVFEYLAAGVPVVASAIDGLTTVLRTHEAVLVPPGDREAFTGALARLITDPVARRRVGDSGRRAAQGRLGWQQTVARIVALATEGTAA